MTWRPAKALLLAMALGSLVVAGCIEKSRPVFVSNDSWRAQQLLLTISHEGREVYRHEMSLGANESRAAPDARLSSGYYTWFASNETQNISRVQDIGSGDYRWYVRIGQYGDGTSFFCTYFLLDDALENCP